MLRELFGVARKVLNRPLKTWLSFTRISPQPQRNLMVCADSHVCQPPVVSKPASGTPAGHTWLTGTASGQPWINGQIVRTRVRQYYRPNPAKRIKTHGIHKRIETEGGLSVLWRRFLKGRHNLAVYEDFRPLLKQFQKPPRKVKW